MALSKKHAQETNWKQKFQKPQNENISLTNLNVENKGYFPILAFRVGCQHDSASLQIGFLFDVMKWVRIVYI